MVWPPVGAAEESCSHERAELAAEILNRNQGGAAASANSARARKQAPLDSIRLDPIRSDPIRWGAFVVFGAS